MRVLAASILAVLSLLLGPIAQAQTILELAEQEGEPAEPEFTWVQRERGRALLGVATGSDRWRSPEEHRSGYDLRMDGQLEFAVEGYEQKRFTWGRSSLLDLRFSLGGGSGSSHSELGGELSTGALFTLDRDGSGVVARISGMGVALLEPGRDAILANVGVPFGLAFHKLGYHAELLFWPSLGWATVVLDEQNRGSGPLYVGSIARFGSEQVWFDGSFTRSVVEAEVDSTRLSLCSRIGRWSLCSDGWWLHVHDILDNEASSFARVGIRLGVGTTANRQFATPSSKSP